MIWLRCEDIIFYVYCRFLEVCVFEKEFVGFKTENNINVSNYCYIRTQSSRNHHFALAHFKKKNKVFNLNSTTFNGIM